MQWATPVFRSICTPTTFPILSDGNIRTSVIDSSVSESNNLVRTQNQLETRSIVAISLDVLAVSEYIVGGMLLCLV